MFVDSVRGSEYSAIVEYAAFQGIPKSRARKKDKNVGSIENEQHFISFLENLKKEEEAENNKSEQITRIEYSYKIKDDKKVTSTPLIEFLSAKNQEKRDAKRQKIEEKRKHRDDDRQKKKIQIAKNVPEPIKEAKEESNEDGIMVRTVPSRLGRSDRKKDSRSESKPLQPEADPEILQERREKREKIDAERKNRRKAKQEEKRKAEREEREDRNKDDSRKQSNNGGADKSVASVSEKTEPVQSKEFKRDAPAKAETKRYSALRKARQEKPDDSKPECQNNDVEPVEEKLSDVSQNPSKFKNRRDSFTDQEKHEAKEARNRKVQDNQGRRAREADTAERPSDVAQPAKGKKPKDSLTDQERLEAKEARIRKVQENRERRAREADERAQRQIKNKDRPTLQIYQPKRRQDNDAKPEHSKSSDDSETARKKSDNDRKNEKKNSRKNSRDESARKKKTSRKNSADGVAESGSTLDGKDTATLSEKLDDLLVESPSKLDVKNNAEE